MNFVILHGYDSSPRALEYLGVLIQNRWPKANVSIPSGPVELADGDNFAWWNDIEPLNGESVSAYGLKLSKSWTIDEATVIIGFSQGGALGVSLGLMATTPPLGVVSISGFAIEGLVSRPVSTKFLVLHGDDDEVVDPLNAMIMSRIIEREQNACERIDFDGAHEVPSNLLELIAPWLSALSSDMA